MSDPITPAEIHAAATFLEAIDRLKEDLAVLSRSVWNVEGFNLQTRTSVFAHLQHAEYALGYTRVHVDRSARAAVEFEQVPGRVEVARV